jgi:hypothetical protein
MPINNPEEPTSSKPVINTSGFPGLENMKESKEYQAEPAVKKNGKSAIKRMINTFHLLTFNLFY